MRECEAIKKDGTPCRNTAELGAKFCFFHNTDSVTGERPEPKPVDLKTEVRIVE